MVEAHRQTPGDMPAVPRILWHAYGDLLVVRFNEPPSRESGLLVLDATRTVAAEHPTLSFVGVVPGRLRTPSPEFRALLAEQSQTIRSSARSIHFAIEGSGFLANLQRAMLSAMSTVVSLGVPFSIHPTGADAMQAAVRHTGRVLSVDITDARRRGLIG